MFLVPSITFHLFIVNQFELHIDDEGVDFIVGNDGLKIGRTRQIFTAPSASIRVEKTSVLWFVSIIAEARVM